MMTETAPLAPARPAVRWRRFARHYLEMIVAMLVGMAVLSPLEALAFEPLGWSDTAERADVGAMLMATNMTVAMGAWMRFRGHRWAPVAEMGAAMYLPFVVLLVPLWTGLISETTLMVAGHVLMPFTMLAAMLFRLDEYSADHAGHE